MNITTDQRRIAFPPKKRGALLTAFIVWQLVANVFGLLLYFVVGHVFLRHMPAWIVLLDLITFLGMTIAFLATLRWKRVGAYSVLVFYLLKSSESVLLGKIFDALLPLGFAAIFVFLLRPHWNDLD